MQRRTGGDHEGTFSKVNGQWKPLEGKMSRGGMLQTYKRHLRDGRRYLDL